MQILHLHELQLTLGVRELNDTKENMNQIVKLLRWMAQSTGDQSRAKSGEESSSPRGQMKCEESQR